MDLSSIIILLFFPVLKTNLPGIIYNMNQWIFTVNVKLTLTMLLCWDCQHLAVSSIQKRRGILVNRNGGMRSFRIPSRILWWTHTCRGNFWFLATEWHNLWTNKWRRRKRCQVKHRTCLLLFFCWRTRILVPKKLIARWYIFYGLYNYQKPKLDF